jgi:hypothetical protein
MLGTVLGGMFAPAGSDTYGGVAAIIANNESTIRGRATDDFFWFAAMVGGSNNKIGGTSATDGSHKLTGIYTSINSWIHGMPGSETTRVAILGSDTAYVAGATGVIVIGGSGVTATSVENTVIIGLNGFTAAASNTTHVQDLNVVGQAYNNYVNKGSTGAGTITFDMSQGNVQRAGFTGNVNFAYTNVKAGANYTIILEGATGSLATPPVEVKFPVGVTPSIGNGSSFILSSVATAVAGPGTLLTNISGPF